MTLNKSSTFRFYLQKEGQKQIISMYFSIPRILVLKFFFVSFLSYSVILIQNFCAQGDCVVLFCLIQILFSLQSVSLLTQSDSCWQFQLLSSLLSLAYGINICILLGSQCCFCKTRNKVENERTYLGKYGNNQAIQSVNHSWSGQLNRSPPH